MAVKGAVGRGIEHLRRVGIAGRDIISAPILELLKTLLSRASFTDAGPWLTEIRMLKSEGEIGIIKRDYQLADTGLDACVRFEMGSVSSKWRPRGSTPCVKWDRSGRAWTPSFHPALTRDIKLGRRTEEYGRGTSFPYPSAQDSSGITGSSPGRFFSAHVCPKTSISR